MIMSERQAVTMQVTARVRLLDERGAVLECRTEEQRVALEGARPNDIQRRAVCGVKAMLPPERSKAKGKDDKPVEQPEGGEV